MPLPPRGRPGVLYTPPPTERELLAKKVEFDPRIGPPTRRVVWLVPRWDRLDGLTRATEGLAGWLRARGYEVEIWSHARPDLPGAVWTPTGQYPVADALPGFVVGTLDATPHWLVWLEKAKLEVPTAVYLHGPSSWTPVSDRGLLERVCCWMIPSRAFPWTTLPGWEQARSIRIVQPGFDPDFYTTDAPLEERQGLLAVGGSVEKGGRLLGAIARAGYPVTVVEGASPATGDLAEIPGLRLLEPVEDLRPLYAHAKLVLVPSKSETYCRVLVEAQAAGTPVLASDLPVLRETGGEAAVYLPGSHVERWIDAIEELSDPEAWRTRSDAGHINAHAQAYHGDVERLVELVEAQLPVPSTPASFEVGSSPLVTCSLAGPGQGAYIAGLRSLGFEAVDVNALESVVAAGHPVLVHGWQARFERLARRFPRKVVALWHSGWTGSDVMEEGGALAEVLRVHRDGHIRLLWLERRDVPPPGALLVAPIWSPSELAGQGTGSAPERRPRAVVAGLHGIYPSAAKNIVANVLGSLAAGAEVHLSRSTLTSSGRGDVLRPIVARQSFVLYDTLPREHVRELLRSVALLVHVSVSDTWPFFPMEAIYGGTPAVVSDVVSWTEQLSKWARARCVVRPATSTRRIAEAVRALLDSPADRERLVQEQREVLDRLEGDCRREAVSVLRQVGFRC